MKYFINEILLSDNEKIVKKYHYADEKNTNDKENSTHIDSEIILTNKRLIHQKQSSTMQDRLELLLEDIAAVSTENYYGHFKLARFFIMLCMLIVPLALALLDFFKIFTIAGELLEQMYRLIIYGSVFLLILILVIAFNPKKFSKVNLKIYTQYNNHILMSIGATSIINKKGKKKEENIKESFALDYDINADAYTMVNELSAYILTIKEIESKKI